MKSCQVLPVMRAALGRAALRRSALLALVALALAAGPARAADARLAVGDRAPALQIADWVKGSAVDVTDTATQRVTVVEFWATWCPPCRESVPHLTELQKKHKGKVAIVGISDETTTLVEHFLVRMGDKMDYAVAIDKRGPRGKGLTDEAYMGGFGLKGIPQAFIVDKDGRIVWQGHPLAGLDEALAKVVEGRWDWKKFAAADKLRAVAAEYLELAAQGESPRLAELGPQVLKADNADLLNLFAWTLMTDKAIKARSPRLALAAAEKAARLSKFRRADILDTYARALHRFGDTAKAVEMQAKAVELTTNPALKDQFQKTLDEYRGYAKPVQ